MKNFEERLKGGHPNSLGNTIEVVETVLSQPKTFKELFDCYYSEDELVRLRISNAMKRICKSQKSLLIPYIDRFLNEVAAIDQASAQWTLAQLLDTLEKDLSKTQEEQAKKIMQKNLENHSDWIVLTQTMNTLAKWAEKDNDLKNWLIPKLEVLLKDERKSVSNKASKMLAKL